MIQGGRVPWIQLVGNVNMTRVDLEAALAAVIDAESTTGLCWWPGSEMAPIVYRRWSSFSRRHKTKRATAEQRIDDLAKGLQAHFEPGIAYTPHSEWLYLAQLLAAVFAQSDTDR
jgi:hypothetical protein